jgi:hypothetical protein
MFKISDIKNKSREEIHKEMKNIICLYDEEKLQLFNKNEIDNNKERIMKEIKDVIAQHKRFIETIPNDLRQFLYNTYSLEEKITVAEYIFYLLFFGEEDKIIDTYKDNYIILKAKVDGYMVSGIFSNEEDKFFGHWASKVLQAKTK